MGGDINSAYPKYKGRWVTIDKIFEIIDKIALLIVCIFVCMFVGTVVIGLISSAYKTGLGVGIIATSVVLSVMWLIVRS